MSGGLIQLVSYNQSDLILTGSPEITFFKSVYRRYTHFAKENVQLYFDGNTNFDEEVSVEIPKNGDLVHKMYLVVDLPEVILTRTTDTNAINTALNTANNYKNTFDQFNQYAVYIINACNLVFNELQLVSVDLTSLNSDVNYYFESAIDVIQFNLIKQSISSTIVSNTDVKSVVNTITADNTIDYNTKILELNQQLQSMVVYLNDLNVAYYNQYLEALNTYNDLSSTNYNFRWIDNIGHFIFDYIDIEIGNQLIDRNYNHWINIWNELTLNPNLSDTYNKMIGNDLVLTGYNRLVKPTYTLYIPLQFWFNKHNGLSLPLISLRYHQVNIKVQFSSLINCIQTDYPLTDIENSIQLADSYLLIDYLFLEDDERKKFAQSGHEYLITEIQSNTFTYNTVQNPTFKLDFHHCITELIWFVKPTLTKTFQNDTNISSYYYSYTDNNYQTPMIITLNPVASGYLQAENYNRFDNIGGGYFNYVVPWEAHHNTPEDGVNVYSFSLHPEEYQPSGAMNFSQYKNINLNLTLDNTFYNYLITNGYTYDVHVFAVSYNILRVFGGFGGLAFSF